jgi:hypothetical protein
MDSQDGVPSNLWRHAAVLLVQHDFARAADRLDEIGDQFSAARANLRAGGDRIPRALEFFRRAGAYRYIMMAEGQLVEDLR